MGAQRSGSIEGVGPSAVQPPPWTKASNTRPCSGARLFAAGPSSCSLSCATDILPAWISEPYLDPDTEPLILPPTSWVSLGAEQSQGLSRARGWMVVGFLYLGFSLSRE